MKATVVNNVENTTRVVEFDTNVITDVAALKHFLNITNDRIFEGITHTDLDNDYASLPQLPEDKRERGYVFFVSPAQNKTKNGVYTRKECYEYIKAHGLGEEIKRKYGRNFTQVSTDSLNSFIASSSHESSSAHESSATPVSTSGETVTEKELWNKLINATVSDTSKKEELNALVDKVFPLPYSSQDLMIMRK